MTQYVKLTSTGLAQVYVDDTLVEIDVDDPKISQEAKKAIVALTGSMVEMEITRAHWEWRMGGDLIHLTAVGGDVIVGDEIPTGVDVLVATARKIISATVSPEVPTLTPEQQLEMERSTMQLSFAQMVIGAVAEGWITQADGEGWLAGVLPPTVLSTISLLQPEHQFAARAKASRPSYVARLDPLVGMMALAQGRSPAEIDAFFRTYAKV